MGDVRLTRDLAAQGYSRGELARLVRSGDLRHVRRGAYADPAARDPRAEHLLLLEATLAQCHPEAVASHVSAAVVHGLPIWSTDLRQVHLTRDRVGRGRVSAPVRVHGSPLGPDDVVVVAGVRVTGLARTAFDLACTLPMERAVAVGDVVLARLGDRDTLHRQLQLGGGRSGVGAARRAIDFLDPRSESPGESYSRVVLHRAGIPRPEPQYEVFGPAGELLARADFAWPELHTLGEFDGRAKYGRLLRPDQSAADAVFAEKVREDRLRDHGWQVVRWIWAELADPTSLVARLERAFRRGARP